MRCGSAEAGSFGGGPGAEEPVETRGVANDPHGDAAGRGDRPWRGCGAGWAGGWERGGPAERILPGRSPASDAGAKRPPRSGGSGAAGGGSRAGEAWVWGVGGWDGAGRVGFAHTVLVDMRERLRRSQRPDRVFEVALAAARQAGLLGRRRVLDSTPLYDAVTTMDTVTLIRAAIRGLLRVVDADLAGQLRAL